jgi:hypothetical protein
VARAYWSDRGSVGRGSGVAAQEWLKPCRMRSYGGGVVRAQACRGSSGDGDGFSSAPLLLPLPSPHWQRRR